MVTSNAGKREWLLYYEKAVSCVVVQGPQDLGAKFVRVHAVPCAAQADVERLNAIGEQMFLDKMEARKQREEMRQERDRLKAELALGHAAANTFADEVGALREHYDEACRLLRDTATREAGMIKAWQRDKAELDALKAEVERLKVQRAGADERSSSLNHYLAGWIERTTNAEAELEALKAAVREAIEILDEGVTCGCSHVHDARLRLRAAGDAPKEKT